MSSSNLSVILPNYNHGEYLGSQLQALATQSLLPMEIIVVDDASTDDSIEIAQSAAEKYSFIRILRNDNNLGTNKTVLRGLKEARGEFLLFAAADDCVSPRLIEKSLEQLHARPEAGVCTALAWQIDPNGRTTGLRLSPHPIDKPGFIPATEALSKLIEHGSWFECVTAVYRRSIFDQLGGFDPLLESYTDAFLCTLIALRHGICFIPEPLSSIRVLSDSYSHVITSDIDLSEKMFRYAKGKMITEYADIFPNDYIDLWDRRWRYTVGNNVILGGKATAGKLSQLIPSGGLIDRTLLKLILGTGKAGQRMAMLYLLGRLLPKDFVAAVARRLRRTSSIHDS